MDYNKERVEIESRINELNSKLEILRKEYDLFFAGEVRVPPEQLREKLEKEVRKLTLIEFRKPRLKLIVNNFVNRFTVYNSMWKKKLNEIELGLKVIKKKKTAYFEKPSEEDKKQIKKSVELNLGEEKTFDEFFDEYKSLLPEDKRNSIDKDKIINTLKTKLITSNIIETKVEIVKDKDKIKLKIKKK